MYKMIFSVYNISSGQYDELGLKMGDTKMRGDEEKKMHFNHIKKVLDDERYLQEKHGKMMNVLAKEEYRDPIRASKTPISDADVANIMMDLVAFEKGRDINEQF